MSRLVAALDPLRIYLFGSRAEGRARPDSDFDLLVVFDDGDAEKVDHDDVYAPLQGLGIGCDVLPCTKSELEAVLHDHSNAWREVWSRARLLHERAA